MYRALACTLVSLASACGAVAQSADDVQEADFTFDGLATVVSDYRYRGWSLSGERPALQLEANVAHVSGFYAGAFASTIEEYGIDADGDGAKVELDISAGWAASVAGFDLDAGAMVYLYPGASDVNYVVLPVSAARSFGEWSVTLGYEYTPSQSSLGDVDGTYVWVGADWASDSFPIWFSSVIGREEGAWAPEGKTDWSLGAFHTLGPVDLGLTYTDTDEAAAGSAVVAELRSHF
ncbi:MAG: TorF family putative porin [Hyphomonadaceae bacterium]|nr:TorF family putative porin [Hyphomonadaceae bacterium]